MYKLPNVAELNAAMLTPSSLNSIVPLEASNVIELESSIVKPVDIISTPEERVRSPVKVPPVRGK